MLDAGGAVLFVQMQDGFGVAVRLVNVAACFKLLAEISVVVDFAVVGNVQSVVFVSHRLMTALDVYDAEATVTETDWAIDEHAFIVRTTMRDDVTHSCQQRRFDAPS